jgi:hypothetical protein
MLRLFLSLIFALLAFNVKAQSCTGCFPNSTPGPCGSTYNTCSIYGAGSAGPYSCYQYARYRAINSSPFPGPNENPCGFSSENISSSPDFIPVPTTTAKFAYTGGHANVLYSILANGEKRYACKVNNDQQIMIDYPLSCFGSALMYLEYIGMITNNGNNNFAVVNVSGLNYQWSISPSCASLSGSNTSSVTVTPDYTGNYTLTLKSWHPSSPSNFRTQSTNVNFTVNNCQLKGKYENTTGLYCLNTFNSVSTNSSNVTVFCTTSGATVTWTKTSGSGSMSSTSGFTNTVYLNAGQNISMDVKAKVGTTVIASRTITFSRGAFQPGSGVTTTESSLEQEILDRSSLPDTELVVYPNPATDVLHVRMAASTRELQVDLVNLTGQHVAYQTIPIGTEEESFPLDIPPGIYLIYIYDGESLVYMDKLVKQ